MNFTPISDYQIGKHLGSGAFGQVKMATHKSTGLLIAFKIYDKQKLEKESRKKCVQKEVQSLKKLNHPNLLLLYDVIDSQTQLYMATEFVHG
jgi:serine/threonine protein kinase